ncbi:uncharacterized protein LOC116615013 [Nematostella vectensis]|uniref:uncharacterized protein LOC116615013 n=1 Tax=Nematostella vectensis TaxID=45351 RepID=UPI00207776BE|nr:uncharacterized protein LOC116615013 [Nematostella vectensis]
MIKILFLITVTCLVAGCVEGKALSPTQCSIAKQFVGNFGVYQHTRVGNNSATNGMMYYDGTKERIRVDVTVKGIFYKIVQLYTEKIQYVIFKYMGKDMCLIQPITKPFDPIVIPAGSVELERGRVGSAKHGMDIIRFYGLKKGAQYIITVTAADCVLTEALIHIPMKQISYFSLTNISRFEVTDADYAHPSDCKHAPERHHANEARDAPSEFYF